MIHRIEQYHFVLKGHTLLLFHHLVLQSLWYLDWCWIPLSQLHLSALVIAYESTREHIYYAHSGGRVILAKNVLTQPVCAKKEGKKVAISRRVVVDMYHWRLIRYRQIRKGNQDWGHWVLSSSLKINLRTYIHNTTLLLSEWTETYENSTLGMISLRRTWVILTFERKWVELMSPKNLSCFSSLISLWSFCDKTLTKTIYSTISEETEFFQWYFLTTTTLLIY